MEPNEIIAGVLVIIGILISALTKKKEVPQKRVVVRPIDIFTDKVDTSGDTIEDLEDTICETKKPSLTITEQISNYNTSSVGEYKWQDGVDTALEKELPKDITDDNFIERHSDIPARNEWRKAIIASEILKTKF
ncbi:MAG: hypothetical protein PHR45_05740 [Muribaculaceae bacterium]|nr:hypothetical protein [Muribaculaceae bacterium]